MRAGTIAVHGTAGRRLLEHMAAVLDPIVDEHAGESAEALRPILRKAWREAFRTELREPTLSRCAAALAAQRPWELALWSND